MQNDNYIGKGVSGNSAAREKVFGNLDVTIDDIRQFDFAMYGAHTVNRWNPKKGKFERVTEYPNGARVIVHK